MSCGARVMTPWPNSNSTGFHQRGVNVHMPPLVASSSDAPLLRLSPGEHHQKLRPAVARQVGRPAELAHQHDAGHEQSAVPQSVHERLQNRGQREVGEVDVGRIVRVLGAGEVEPQLPGEADREPEPIERPERTRYATSERSAANSVGIDNAIAMSTRKNQSPMNHSPIRVDPLRPEGVNE